jgi:hypothetical protein
MVLWASSLRRKGFGGSREEGEPQGMRWESANTGALLVWSSMVGWWPGPAATSPGETEGSPCVTPPVARTEPKISVDENSAGKLAVYTRFKR